MSTKVLEYLDPEYHVQITVGRATVRSGMARTRLAREQTVLMRLEESKNTEEGIGTLDDRAIRIFTYPACLGALVKIENVVDSKTGKPEKEVPAEPTLEELYDLPDAMVFQWEEMVYELNPHWAPRMPPMVTKDGKEEEEPEGKDEEPDSTGSSSTPS